MSDWLNWATQPFSSASSSSKQEAKAHEHPPPPYNTQQSGKEEKEEKVGLVSSSSASSAAAAPSSSSSSSSSVASWLPSLPSLSLPSFLSSASSTSAASSASSAHLSFENAAAPPPYPLPCISSSPSTSLTSTPPPLIQPPPADVSYLRSLLATFTSSSSSSSSSAASQPTSGVTPSGLRWEKVDGVKGFALSMPTGSEDSKEYAAQHRISDEELAHVKHICQQLQQQQQPQSSNVTLASSASPTSSPSKLPAPMPSATALHAITTGGTALCSTSDSATAQSSEREVALLDIDSIDWWELVDPGRSKEAAAEYNIEENYVVVRHEDTVDAMAQYLAQVLANHPYASQLSARELAAVIDKSLRPLEPRRYWLSGRYVTYGYYAYLAYSWSATAYSMYRRPWLIKLVATGAVQAASWLLVLFV